MSLKGNLGRRRYGVMGRRHELSNDLGLYSQRKTGWSHLYFFPTTIEAYFDLIRRLDQAQLAELPVSVGIGETTATTDGVSAGNFNILVDRVLREVVQKIPPSGNRACLKCGMKGHVAWQCPSMRDFGAIPKSPEAQGN